MEELLNKVNQLINSSNNIPEELKPIIKCICRGYIRESNGQITIEGIMNVCNTHFIKIDESNNLFKGEENILGCTETNYDNNCNVIHRLSYVNASNYIKLILIMVHELGHVITESKPCTIDNDIYPLAKRTTTIYHTCMYQDNILTAKNFFGFRMADGFLESISSKIVSSPEFRQELKNIGYDLENYEYKDERLFPSRIYDEYKACFELFDYIMDGKLFEFSCMTFNSNEELETYIKTNRLEIIFFHLDKSNDALWALKKYEGKEWTKEFEELLNNYQQHKNNSLLVAEICAEWFGKSKTDQKYQELYETYSKTLDKQKTFPSNVEFKQNQQK